MRTDGRMEELLKVRRKLLDGRDLDSHDYMVLYIVVQQAIDAPAPRAKNLPRNLPRWNPRRSS